MALFTSDPMPVEPGWLDYNGHMNMAYYAVLFDRGADAAYPLLGIGPEYRATRGFTTYTAEFHICYLRELHLGDRVRCSFRLLDYDTKRFHTYQELWHDDGWCAATAEGLALHIDTAGPRVTPFPADVAAKLAAMQAAQAALPAPDRVGRRIGIPRSA